LIVAYDADARVSTHLITSFAYSLISKRTLKLGRVIAHRRLEVCKIADPLTRLTKARELSFIKLRREVLVSTELGKELAQALSRRSGSKHAAVLGGVIAQSSKDGIVTAVLTLTAFHVFAEFERPFLFFLFFEPNAKSTRGERCSGTSASDREREASGRAPRPRVGAVRAPSWRSISSIVRGRSDIGVGGGTDIRRGVGI